MSQGNYNNDNSGALFKNRRKTEGSKQPDYTGNITINGEEMRLSAWIKSGKNGPFMSLQASPKQYDGGQRNSQPSQNTASDDGIPF